MDAGVVEVMTRGFEELPLTQAAIDFARSHHEGQRREADDAPFVVHPLEVAILLRDAGYPDHVVAIGALHEVLEDTDVDKDELEERFGPDVAELVDALTDDPSIEDQQERRAALRRQVATAGGDAAAVFAADKVSKSRELRLKAERGPLDEENNAKLEHYRQSLRMLEDVLPGSDLVDCLRSELRGLAAL
jgi:(p)ppGpp synthase/HD superfamily hydrolase